MKRHWLMAPVAWIVFGCGGSTRTTGFDLCTPGTRIACECIGHVKGQATCSADGVGYGDCVCNGSTSGDASVDDGMKPPSPSACTSNSVWTEGSKGSPNMTPGRACIACHMTTPKAPALTVAGTIFPALHDPDDCNGADGLGVAVAFMDDQGNELGPRLQVNQVGNFYQSRPLPAQYQVKVISAGRESVMQTPVTNGDCNLCHTSAGQNGAAGRLTKF